MKKRAIFRCGPVLGLLVWAAGCSEVPISGRSQFNLVPDLIMQSMSLDAYKEFLSEHPLGEDGNQVEMVKRVGQNIQKAVEKYSRLHQISLSGYEWEFNLVKDPAVNAWAMSGGKVVVYTGLLTVATDDARLAVVMGHEIAHAIAKHGSERMTQGLLTEMGGRAMSRALAEYPEKTQSLFLKSYGLGTQVGVLLPFSRLHETEADHLGVIFMAMAGYDPRVAVDFWQEMAAKKDGSAPPEFLSTHPADETRIRNIKEVLPEALRYYLPPG